MSRLITFLKEQIRKRFPLDPSLKRLTPYLAPYRWKMLFAFLFMTGAGLSSSLMAKILGMLTDIGFYERSPWVVVAAPVGLVLIASMHGFCMFSSNYLLARISQSTLVKMRGQLFHKMLHWPAERYQRNSSGQIVMKFVFEANAALTSAAKSSIIFIRNLVQVICLSLVLIWHNPMLTFVVLVIGPTIICLLKWIAKKTKAIFEGNLRNLGSFLSRIRECYGAQRLIKVSATQKFETERYRMINQEMRDLGIKMSKVGSLGTPLTQLIGMCGVAVVLTIALFQARAGQSSVGDFVTFIAAMLLLLPPLRQLAGLNSSLVTMGIACKSLFRTLDDTEEEDNGTEVLQNVKGAVTFEHVSHRYPGAVRDAVHDFSLTVNPGDTIALVGLSGSGKSTLVNLIPRFWNPSDGRILIDGTDTQNVTLASLRDQIAVVSQDVVLFDDSIRANIAYGCPDATDEDIARAVEAAALTDVIADMPEGYDTKVGDRGSRLSGGQRQRVSIARALLKNAPILILDEATSALDSDSERRIQTALDRLMANRTCFVVAHRLSTIERATKILVMSDGIVRESGTHAELLRQNGVYANLYRLQTPHSGDAQTEPAAVAAPAAE